MGLYNILANKTSSPIIQLAFTHYIHCRIFPASSVHMGNVGSWLSIGELLCGWIISIFSHVSYSLLEIPFILLYTMQ